MQEVTVTEAATATEKFTPIQLSPALVEKLVQKRALSDELEKQAKEAHEDFWGAVYEAHPELDKETSHTLDAEYLEQGIVMLKKKPCRSDCSESISGTPAEIKKLLLEAILKRGSSD